MYLEAFITNLEYPPGVVLVPMGSRTRKPFHTTNLVVFAPKNVPNDSGKNGFIACGDALIVDPGCQSKFHEEVCLREETLVKELVVQILL
ncbi:hypothetical protein RchiOBHm_Chr2g0108931 [Rosa chinensis]|uniref:Uncharacterized protein n=1 Tax=Rosa chinensis TaxID=74649 RepID=A0A2P6RPB2_ROSCH|nr:hypothetical protein RchiOBHm_Chr2g0108931 [Rosa chinensis]